MDEASTAMDVERRDAFAVMMANATILCPPDDPWTVACLYKITLLHVDSSEPLFGITYHGQTLGPGDLDPDKVVAKRWKQEVYDAGRKHKQVGLLAALETFGADAFHFQLVASKRGRRSVVQQWADEGEVRAIAVHGGVLRSMTERCAQTLNLTKGGQGNLRWEGLDAFRMVAFERFKTAMEAYVAEFGTALVPHAYVAPSGYKLGQRLGDFRSQGNMRVGLPKQNEIEAWAEALPKWAWNGLKTDEYKEVQRQAGVKRWADLDAEKRAEWVAAQTEAQNRPDVVEANRQRMIAQGKRERFDEPELGAKRAAKSSATCDAKFEAKLKGKTEEEQRKMKLERACHQRSNAKNKAALARLRTVMPEATFKDLAQAKRKGLVPPPEADASGVSASTA